MARAAKHVPRHDGESRSRTGQGEESPARQAGLRDTAGGSGLS